jgi:ribosomal protein S14
MIILLNIMNLTYYWILKKKLYYKKFEILFKLYNYFILRYHVEFKLNFINNINQYFNISSKLENNWKILKLKQQCLISQRNRSNYKLFGLSRFCIKEFISTGNLPNIKKISW